MKSPHWAGRVVKFLTLLAIVAVALDFIQVQSRLRYFDFVTYYAAGKAVQQGLSPYSLEALSTALGQWVGRPFLYSPAIPWLFSLCTKLPLMVAGALFFLLKLGLVTWVGTALRRRWAPDADLSIRLLAFVFLVFGLGEALRSDLREGNVTGLEFALLWGSFLAWDLRKFRLYVALAFSAGVFKLVPWGFVILPLLDTRVGLRKRVVSVIAVLACVGAWLGAQWLAWPEEFVRFLGSGVGLSDAYPVNFSPWALARAAGAGAEQAGWIAGITGVGAVLVTGFALRRANTEWWDQVAAIVLLSAFILPRFKNYGFMLLVPAVFYLFLRHRAQWSRATLGVLFLTLLRYAPFAPVVAVLWYWGREFAWRAPQKQRTA